jgi:hypothetical protein
MNDYKDQNLKSAVLTGAVVASIIIAVAIYLAIN